MMFILNLIKNGINKRGDVMADIDLIPMGDGGAKKIHKSLYMTVPQTVSIAADGTVGSFTIRAYALTHTIILKLPNWSEAVTATISIENSNGDEIYSNDSLAKNTTHVISAVKPLVETNTVKITLSGVPGGTGGDTTTTLYLTGN